MVFSGPLFSQEQVSDIETFGVVRQSDLTGRIGFAQFDDANYMLVENDSLTIYIWDNDEFKPFISVKGQGELIDLKDRDRSLMAIRDGKYYRYINNGIQIIDIATGDIDFDSTHTCEEFEKPLQVELVDSSIYLYFQDRNSEQYKLLNFATGALVDLGINRPEHQIGHLALITSDSAAVIKNLLTDEETEISIFPSGIAHRISSRIDTSFIIIDKEDKIWKLKYDEVPFLYDCPFFDVSIENITIKGDLLISTKASSFGDRVTCYVQNLNNCSFDLISSIRLEEYQHFLKTRFISNANCEPDFTVVNIDLVQTNSDGVTASRTIVIDHINNKFIESDDMVIEEGSPFRYDGNIYLHGLDFSFRGTNNLRVPISKVNPLVEESRQINSSSSQVVMGYPIDDFIICATNTNFEDIKIWKIDRQDEFEEIQSISLSNNHGLYRIRKIFTYSDDIYYNTINGVYRLSDNNKLLIPADHRKLLSCPFCFELSLDLDIYDNKIRYLEDAGDNRVLHIYDAITENLVTFNDSLFNDVSFQSKLIGPFQVFSDPNMQNETGIIDIRDGSISKVSEDISTNFVIPFDDFALFKSRYSDQLNSIDYTSLEISTIPFDFGRQSKIFNNKNGTAYIIDISDSNIRIRRLKSLMDIETIYEGSGTASIPFRPFLKSHGSNVSYITFSEDGINKVFLDDSENSRLYTLFENEYISDIDKDHLLIQNNTSFNGGDGVIGRIRPFEDIQRIQNDFLSDPVVYEELIGDTAFFLFKVGEDSLRSIYYNLESGSFSAKIIRSNIEHYYNWIRLDDNRLFFTGEGLDYCGIEPRILDLDKAKISLLSDINRGPESSHIENFIETKNGLFFTAIISGVNRQWFSLSIDDVSAGIKPVNQVLDLEIYPNPTSCNIRVRKGFESISVFSQTGVEVIKLDDVDPSVVINLGSLESGTYIVIATDFLGRKSITKVVKI